MFKIIKNSLVTSIGFTLLLIGQIVIHNMNITTFADYFGVQGIFWVTLTLIFVPSMLIREYYKTQNDIENKLNTIITLLEND